MDAHALARIIRLHGYEATTLATGKLLVASRRRLPDGQWYTINEVIPARLGPVRSWLGY
jgi:hypothetical protein